MIVLESIVEFLKKHKDQVIYQEGERLFSEGKVTLIWQSPEQVSYEIDDHDECIEVALEFDESGELRQHELLTKYYFAALIDLKFEFQSFPVMDANGKIYSREGMIRRVIGERKERALSAEYKVTLGKFLYGPHTLLDENNNRYDITIWDFEKYKGIYLAVLVGAPCDVGVTAGTI